MITPERRSIEVEGLGHGQLPIPAASRVGPLIATGGVRGVERQTREMPTDATEQIACMFENLRAVIEAAGGSIETILKVTVYVKTAELRSLLNAPWVEQFPDPARRPVRHVIENDRLGGGMLVQCEALALVVGG
jgi:2-iminobutanoate/2-iminopropanoate deaminase